MPESRPTDESALARLHLRTGWWSLLVFLTLGIVLESFHGFKIGWYLDVSNATRREMWTLAHAHGTLVSLINIIFGLTAHRLTLESRRFHLASRFLLAGSFLLPVGFFLGGLYTYGADPGLGILLVPAGGLALLLAVLITARAVTGGETGSGAVELPAAKERGSKRRR